MTFQEAPDEFLADKALATERVTQDYYEGRWTDFRDFCSLEEAQEAKLEQVCRALNLQPGMRVLGIGCGWGGTAKFAAEHYGVQVVGITVSQEQANLARETCRGLPVDIRLQDCRSLNEDERFDRVLSLGMFEHVGYKNYRNYMQVVRNALTENGLFLLRSIGSGRSAATGDVGSSAIFSPTPCSRRYSS